MSQWAGTSQPGEPLGYRTNPRSGRKGWQRSSNGCRCLRRPHVRWMYRRRARAATGSTPIPAIAPTAYLSARSRWSRRSTARPEPTPVGPLNGNAGRDHYQQQAALFTGAKVRGGRALGTTDERGARTVDPGWSRDRDVRAEDVEATIYSALGIDWTTLRRDNRFGRGYEYVPLSDQDVYGPINELWR